MSPSANREQIGVVAAQGPAAAPFRGKRIVITGASDGIGKELALQLAQYGANLALAARNMERLEQVVIACRAFGIVAEPISADLADPHDCQLVISRAAETLGGIDILVNNAGITCNIRFDELKDLTMFERMTRVNFLGAVHCTFHALPYLKESRGIIVAVSSLQGKTGFPWYSGYAASKHAMTGFFESLRIELASSGVEIMLVYPGAIGTAIHKYPEGTEGRLNGGELAGPGIMPVSECARQMIKAMEQRKRELLMTPISRAIIALKVIAPRLLDRVIDGEIRKFLKQLAASSK